MTAPAAMLDAAPGRLDRFAETTARLVPDAITASIVLVLVLAIYGLAMGNDAARLIDAYYRGLWMLLPFTMQMALLILMSSALALTPTFRKGVAWLATLPKNQLQVVTGSILLNGVFSYSYWALGLSLGPVIAVCYAREAERKGIAIDFPFLLAAIGAEQAVWQYGLSSSGPLMVATQGHFLASTIGVLPLSKTIGTPAAMIQVAVFTGVLILAAWQLMPKACRAISTYPESAKLADADGPDTTVANSGSERLERSPFPAVVLCGFFAVWLWHHFLVKRSGVDLNALNTILFLLTFLLHGNVRNVTRAIEKAVRSAWPVIVLYHLYAGVAGIIQFTNIGEKVAWMTASVANARTFPALNAIISTVFGFFIPSSGGQWTIQGYVTVKSAMAVGVSVPRAMLSLGVGDHMGNFISPFWYVVTAGIVRLDFRKFFGYGLVFGAIWFVLGILVFTFAPC